MDPFSFILAMKALSPHFGTIQALFLKQLSSLMP